MRRKADYDLEQRLIAEAQQRLLCVLREHHGWFPYTSEFAASTGMPRTYNRIAIERLLETGAIYRVPMERGAAGYMMADQQPGPLLQAVITRAHRASVTVNARGSDCHPWRNATLVCPICAAIRAAHPEWRITAEDQSAAAIPSASHRPAHTSAPGAWAALSRGYRAADANGG